MGVRAVATDGSAIPGQFVGIDPQDGVDPFVSEDIPQERLSRYSGLTETSPTQMRSPLALLARVSPPSTDERDAVATCKLAVSAVCARALTAVRAVAFWTAVLLPLAYLPLFLAGVVGAIDPLTLVALVCFHAVAVLVGHVHEGGIAERFEQG